MTGIIRKGAGLMEITFKSRNFEITEALKAYTEKKLARLAKYFEPDPIETQVMMSMQREIHTLEVTLNVRGLLLRCEEKTGDMYASIDGAVDKLERQIHKFKTRISRKIKEAHGQQAVTQPPTLEEEPEPVIVRTKRFTYKPMTAEEAVMQMDLLGHDFFVFTDTNSQGHVCVVYRRKDGNYGLIEPEH
jgi:putative sigma-54 modulation protein